MVQFLSFILAQKTKLENRKPMCVEYMLRLGKIMNDSNKKIIIEGATEDGKTFRPSDWAERMSGALSSFQKHRIIYSPLLQPSVKDGNKCVMLDPALKTSNPELYQSILDFAKVNKLKICDEEDKPSDEATAEEKL